MYFLTLTEEEFDGFIKRNFSHYTQSKNHYAYRNKFKKDVHIVGVKNEQNEVIAATLLTEARSMKFFKYFYTHRGPVLDFNNEELVSFFFENLTKYLKKQRCLYVLVDPYIVINKYEADGNKINEYEHHKLIEMLEEQGYKHQGYSVGYQPMSQIRWLSVLDLKDKSEQTLLKELNYQTRRNIKKTDEMGVQVHTLKIEETDRFFNLFKMAEEKHGFSFRGIDYFKEMQAIYHDNSVLKVATINLTNYLNQLKNQQTSLSNEMSCIEKNLQENPNSKKQKTLMQNVKQRYDSTAKRIDKVKNLISTDGEVIDLAAALYIYNDYEMYYLSSGSNPKYNEFMGAYKLQWEMIKFSKERGIDRYNFYGVTGDFNDTAEDYGVQQFKKGFNAEVEEYIGDFIKPIKKNWFAVNKLLQKIK